MNTDTRYLLGGMTGTSLDGLDLALVKIIGRGLGMTAELIDHHHQPLGELAGTLSLLAEGKPAAPLVWLEAGRALGRLHADAARKLLADHDDLKVDFMVAHGQTLWHAPDRAVSWQLFDPWPVVHDLGMTVCHDLRQADLVAGGQGAPITPLSDLIMFGDSARHRLVVNLGGICNVTNLPAGSDPTGVTGCDIGVCNLLIDGLVQRCFPGKTFDRDGQLSAAGMIDPSLRDAVHENPFHHRPEPRTAGREDFSNPWLDQLHQRFVGHLSPHDFIASAVDAVARDIAAAADRTGADEIILAGGGALNPTLKTRIAEHAHATVRTSDELGVPVPAREAMAMAVLGALARDGVTITLPQVTGAKNITALAGTWTHAAPGNVSGGKLMRNLPAASPDRGHLLTEQRLVTSKNLDTLTIQETLTLINQQDATVADVVREAIPSLAALVESVVQALRRGGRLIYLGAGTSGRLGVLDASECPPTFFSDPSQVVGIIAGGDTALRKSSEGAEDDPRGAAEALRDLNVGPHDVIVGIAAGGTTPYVRGGLTLAKNARAGTALICCVRADHLGDTRDIDHVISLPTGGEVVTGSTRMKAGTATKLALNMISTAAMVQLGKTYGNLMVDLRAANAKLVDRALRLLASQADLAGPQAIDLLQRADGSVKIALVMAAKNVDATEAVRLLAKQQGSLRAVIGPPRD